MKTKGKRDIQEESQILNSKKDCLIFFNAITNPKNPSKNLKKALKEYYKFIQIVDFKEA